VGTLSHQLGRVWRWLARPDVLVGLIIALLALLVLGTLVPQLPADPLSLQQLAEWRALARTRYGPLASLLEGAGAFRVYRSPVLWTLIALLGAATLSCTLRRWRGRWRSVFDRPGARSEDGAAALTKLFESASHSEIIEPSQLRPAGGVRGNASSDLNTLTDVASQALARHDYRVRSESTAELVWLRGDRNRLATLATVFDHLAVLLILVGVCLSAILGWRESLTIDPGGTVQVDHGTGIALHNEGFDIERYQDGSPAAYTARITIGKGATTAPRAIGVNQPANIDGVWFYLQGYRQQEGRYALTLLAVHDPGFGVIVAGALMLLASTLVALYFPRTTVIAQITVPTGTLRLAGWADHRAYSFDQDFAALAADLRREWNPAGEATVAAA
jgi:cytochrome c biogenesis protein ResB